MLSLTYTILTYTVVLGAQLLLHRPHAGGEQVAELRLRAADRLPGQCLYYLMYLYGIVCTMK